MTRALHHIVKILRTGTLNQCSEMSVDYRLAVFSHLRLYYPHCSQKSTISAHTQTPSHTLTHFGSFHVKSHTWVIRDSIVQQGRDTRQVTESLCVLSGCVWLAALKMVISWVQDPSCHCVICLIEKVCCCESRQIRTPSVCKDYSTCVMFTLLWLKSFDLKQLSESKLRAFIWLLLLFKWSHISCYCSIKTFLLLIFLMFKSITAMFLYLKTWQSEVWDILWTIIWKFQLKSHWNTWKNKLFDVFCKLHRHCILKKTWLPSFRPVHKGD